MAAIAGLGQLVAPLPGTHATAASDRRLCLMYALGGWRSDALLPSASLALARAISSRRLATEFMRVASVERAISGKARVTTVARRDRREQQVRNCGSIKLLEGVQHGRAQKLKLIMRRMTKMPTTSTSRAASISWPRGSVNISDM